MFPLDPYLISVIALACALPIVWWLARRSTPQVRVETPGERLDTLVAWPPESMRIMRSSERLAFSTLKLALPGYLILAQVPIARFIAVPKRYSYAEWMRRLGSQCVDFVVCDATTQVVAVIEIRPPSDQINEKVKARFDRVARTLKSASIPLHVWNEEKLPTIEIARDKLLRDLPAAAPAAARRPPVTAELPLGVPATAALGASPALAASAALASSDGDAMVAAGPAADPFADTDRDWSQEQGDEVIEVVEPVANTWYDELDEPVSAVLPPAAAKG